MPYRIITVEHTQQELVREFSLNEALACTPTLVSRFVAIFSYERKYYNRFLLQDFTELFSEIFEVEDAQVRGNTLIITVFPWCSHKWPVVQEQVIQTLRVRQGWDTSDPVRIDFRVPSV
jgi:hypothetical protein